MKGLVFLLAAIIPLIFISCEKQEKQDINRTTLKIGFKATGNALENLKTLRSSTGEGILIDTALIILEKINLWKQGASDTVYNPGKYLLAGPYQIDLISKKSQPDIPPAEIAPGIYGLLQGMLFKPAGFNYNIYISGTYTKDTQWWRFIYSYDTSSVFRAKSSTGFEIAENSSNSIWIMIDVVALFKGVDFSHASVSNGNMIIINASSNSSLDTIIENNFEGSILIDNGTGTTTTGNENNSGNAQKTDNNSSKVSGNDENKDKNKSDNNNKDKNKKKKKDKVNNNQKDKNKDKDKDKNKEKDKD